MEAVGIYGTCPLKSVEQFLASIFIFFPQKSAQIRAIYTLGIYVRSLLEEQAD